MESPPKVEGIKWYESKGAIAQIVGIIFAVVTAFGVDVTALGLTEEQTIGGVMFIIAFIGFVSKVFSGPKVVENAKTVSALAALPYAATVNERKLEAEANSRIPR